LEEAIAAAHILIIDAHFSSASVANVCEPNSQISCASQGHFLNLDDILKFSPQQQVTEIA
jgi:hypothetical protein